MSDGKKLSLLRLVNITKEFPGVRALNDVNFELKSGEVHVLFGENGAGKSTLISIVAGATKPTAGEVWIRGESVHLNSVHEAREFGISAVFQEFSLVPQMTVEENLFLGSEIVRKREFCRNARYANGSKKCSKIWSFNFQSAEGWTSLPEPNSRWSKLPRPFARSC